MQRVARVVASGSHAATALIPVAMVLGYAGWGAGQLEGEMREGSWIPVDLDYDLVFGTPVEARWEVALASLGIDPSRVIDSRIASA